MHACTDKISPPPAEFTAPFGRLASLGILQSNKFYPQTPKIGFKRTSPKPNPFKTCRIQYSKGGTPILRNIFWIDNEGIVLFHIHVMLTLCSTPPASSMVPSSSSVPCQSDTDERRDERHARQRGGCGGIRNIVFLPTLAPSSNEK